MSFLVDFMLGGASAAAAKLGSAPLDRGKLVLQAQGELLRQGRIGRPYGGMFDALAATVRTEGPLGLWRGVLCDVVAYFPTQALNFALKDSYRQLFPWTRQQHGYGLWFIGNLLSGCLAGATTLLFTTPLHLARTVLAADVLAPELGRTAHQYAGVADVLSKTLKHSGPLGLFNGFGVSVAGVVLYRAFYFGLYDSLKVVVAPQDFLSSFLVSWSVTVVAGLVTFPFDTVRRRLMIAGATPMAYTSTLDCVATIWREEGIEGFFRGALANIARSIVAACILCLYDALMVAPQPPAPPAAHHNANQGDDDDE